jgi:hypothetical protein
MICSSPAYSKRKKIAPTKTYVDHGFDNSTISAAKCLCRNVESLLFLEVHFTLSD